MIVTDHAPLKYLMQMKDGTSHLAHWSLLLQEYSFEVKHHAGAKHANADALSRIHIDCCQYCTCCLIEILHKLSACAIQTTPNNSSTTPINPSTNTDYFNFSTTNLSLHECQLQDSQLKSVFDYLENNILPLDSKHAELVKSQASIYNVGPNNALHYANLPSM